MTNERAIELLRRLQDEQFDGIHGDERREALSIAVRALQTDGDTISKQETIEYCVGNMTWHEQKHWIPCDWCKYNPPSSMDGKPCMICPAVGRGESE